jgi:fatty-acyl-CoA synthase
MEFAFATIWESVADAIPDRPAVVQGNRRVTWRDYDDRAARLAGALAAAGLGPDSKVALYLYNSPEYAEANYAAMKLRGIPVNVNYRYLDDELAYLLDNSDAEAVVFHSSLGERVEVARKRSDRVRLWIEVDDGGAHLDGAERYDDLIAAATPAPRLTRSADDHYILYTGGTTGMPKGVVYRQGPLVQSFLMQMPMMAGEGPVMEAADAAPLATRLAAEGRGFVALPACPLMHGTGAWAGLYGPTLLGGTTVLTTGRSLDPAELFGAIERERVAIVVIVGESFARPMIRHLDEQSYDLASLRLMISSGAMFSAEAKAALCEHVPTLMIVDTIGSSEGIMGQSMTAKGASSETARFNLNPTTKVFTEDGREVAPGSGEAGLVAVGGANVPLGYYKDEVKSAATFKEIGGVRYSIPGDWATVAEDGSIVLLGRGGSCINTGGEKVYPEEVEEAIKTHPAVEDCLVFGIDDERFGQAVAAVASLAPGVRVTSDEIVAHGRTRLAAYKAPKRLVVVERVPRTPSGKADYPAAKSLFAGEAT